MAIPQTEVLITVDGAELGRHVFAPGEYVLGRNPDCHIPIEADLVSRRHAKLTLNFDTAFIEDLGSGNGTQVNGKPVTGSTRLWPNQKIQIGAATIELRRLKAAADPEATLAPTAGVLRRVLPEEFLRERKYDIGGVVAQGGMGAILDAKEATTGRTVAMKVMLDSNSPDDLLRFVTEAKITAQLEHPSIVPVYELSVDENGQVFYTMKFVKGITLKKVLALLADGIEATVKKYPLTALLTIFQKVCDAIAFAHSKGVIHRDLKPENIMIGDFGSVLVMDWGLAKVLDPARANASAGPAQELRSMVHTVPVGGQTGSMTLAGTIMGTPHFMSPEQARGEVETLDARSDIYALGAILYQIITLRLPVEGRDVYEVLAKVGKGEVAAPLAATASKRLSHLPAGRVPESLNAVVMKAMALNREARYGSVPELQREIEAYQTGFATGAENAGVVKQIRLLVLRHKAMFTTAFLAWAIITALVVWFVININRERKVAIGERNRAESERKTADKERNRAEAALTDLRSAAPTLIGQARGLIDQQKFDDALEKIDFAVKIDAGNADYRLLRAQVLEVVLRLDEAASEFRRVLALGPNDSAAANLALCEKLLRDNQGGADIGDTGLKALHELMLKEQRTTQDVPIAARLGLGRAATDARIKALFDAWRKLPGWDKVPEKDRFSYLSDGAVNLSLANLPIGDLSILKGIPISVLNISFTKAEDLSPLAGLRLVKLTANNTSISDLSPLRGMPLKSINLGACHKVEDLSPLAGMPLKDCDLSQVQATDFSPLTNCPIKELNVSGTRITTLDAFGGIPCEKLVAGESRALVDISAVRTMRLKIVNFNGSTGIQDLAPLADCADLEIASVPFKAKNVASLRRITKLRSIYTDLDQKSYSPEEFWLKLGIGDDRDREHAALVQKARAAMVAAGWPRSPEPALIKVLPDGTLDLVMHHPDFKTLTPLRGLPVSVLDIFLSSITDLSPVADMPLRQLNISKTRIPDLSPLTKCPKLEVLVCYETAVRDLSPLAGLPLVYLNVSWNSVSSIAPLAGMPLKELWLHHTSVSDLRPLLSCPTLERLILPPAARDIGQLRALKKLVRLSDRWDVNLEGPAYDRGGVAQTAEEFWKEYDATHVGAPK